VVPSPAPKTSKLENWKIGVLCGAGVLLVFAAILVRANKQARQARENEDVGEAKPVTDDGFSNGVLAPAGDESISTLLTAGRAGSRGSAGPNVRLDIELGSRRRRY
jgi:hypothetical protein